MCLLHRYWRRPIVFKLWTWRREHSTSLLPTFQRFAYFCTNIFPDFVALKTNISLVICEYSKFHIESNSYLLFNSIRNWRNYSKFSNTYLTVISLAIDTQFVCTLPATSRCTHLTLNPVLRHVCSYTSHSPECPDHAPMLSRVCMHACSQHQVSTVASDCVITAWGKHSAWSVERWPCCQYFYGFNFNTETCCI